MGTDRYEMLGFQQTQPLGLPLLSDVILRKRVGNLYLSFHICKMGMMLIKVPAFLGSDS